MVAIREDQVRLRVVGVFYDKNFSYDAIVNSSGNNNPTIKDLLDFAVKDGRMVDIPSGPNGETQKINCFGYTAARRFKPADTAANPPTVDGIISSLLGFEHTLASELMVSLGKKIRKVGYYKLFESTSIEKGSVTVHAWQYYLIRGNVIQSNYWPDQDKEANPDVSPAYPTREGDNGGGAGFTPFDTVSIDPGDEVVWRNVSIVRNPQTPPIY